MRDYSVGDVDAEIIGPIARTLNVVASLPICSRSGSASPTCCAKVLNSVNSLHRYFYSIVGPWIASKRDRAWKSSVIRSEIRSRAELDRAFAFVCARSTPTRYRAQTHWHRSTSVRRRFGYCGEQIGHLRDQGGLHFGARRQNLSLQPRVGLKVLVRFGRDQRPRMIRFQGTQPF
jgi:hypothetical protein